MYVLLSGGEQPGSPPEADRARWVAQRRSAVPARHVVFTIEELGNALDDAGTSRTLAGMTPVMLRS